MRVWIGKSIVLIGIAHGAAGLIAYRSEIVDLVRAGLVNTISVTGDHARDEAFWFLIFTIPLLIIGGLVDRMERLGQPLPAATVSGVAGMTAVGIVMMPASGFWMLIVPVVGMVRRGPGDKG
jgi:hypothetical protein